MGVWPPTAALQEEAANQCMLLTRKPAGSKRYVKRQHKLSGKNSGDERK